MERYIIAPFGSRQIDEISAPLVIHTVQPASVRLLPCIKT